MSNNMKEKRIIKIEPNPGKKSSVKIKMQVINMAGGVPKYTYNDNGEKKVSTKMVEPKQMSRLPNTVVEYAAGVQKNGALKTGLDELVDNPYSNLSYYRPGWESILKNVDKIRLQELLEYKHGRELGYYTAYVNEIKGSYDNDLKFYQKPEARVYLNDGVTYLDLDNPNHELNYHMLKSHKMVANSLKELQENPYATHYIVDDEEKSNVEAAQVRRMHKFGARLEELLELPNDIIIDFTKALGIGANTGMKKSEAYTTIDEHVRKNSANYDEFMLMYKLWNDPASREVFEGYVELFDFLSIPGLLSTRGSKLFWNQPLDPEKGGKRETYEWKNKSEFVRNFLNEPKYSEEVEILRSLYRSKARYEDVNR